MAFTSVSPSLPQILRAALVVTFGLVAVVSAKAEIRYTAQQRIACMPDAFRLCSDAIPDVAQVRNCMIAHKASLSASCRAVF